MYMQYNPKALYPFYYTLGMEGILIRIYAFTKITKTICLKQMEDCQQRLARWYSLTN